MKGQILFSRKIRKISSMSPFVELAQKEVKVRFYQTVSMAGLGLHCSQMKHPVGQVVSAPNFRSQWSRVQVTLEVEFSS